jgi:ribokinase
MEGGTVLVVGGINTDLVVQTPARPGAGETVLGTDCVIGPGGKGANQAVAAAVAGAAVAMVGAVGADPWGREQLAGLERFGVDVRKVKVLMDVPTGLAAIAVTPDGENSVLVAPGANHALDAEGLISSVDGSADVVVAQCELTPEVIEAAGRFARSAGARLIISAGPVIPLDSGTLGAADPLVVNQHEARDIVCATAPREQPASTGVALASQLLRVTGAVSVVATLGADGAAVATTEGAWLIPAERVDPVDTTGAGDAFVGTLAARLARGDHLREAARHAAAAAARSVMWHGTRPPDGWSGP